MFPNITQPKKLTAEEMQRLQCDNSTKMVEILASLAKSNEEMARKTDMLLKSTLDMVGASRQMNRCSEEATRQATEAVRYIKRIGRKMLEMVPPQMDARSDRLAPSIHEEQQPMLSSPIKAIGAVRAVDPAFTGKVSNDGSQINETHANGHNDGAVMDRLLTMEKKMSEMMISISQIREGDNVNLRVSFSKVEDALVEAMRKVQTGETAKLDKTVLYLQISTWVGDLFRQVSDLSYRKYLKHEMSESEARLMFCQTIILNLLDFMDYMRRSYPNFWIPNRVEILDLCSQSARNILKFLKSKYPRNAKNFKSVEFESLVEKVNNSQDPRYDILKNIGIELPPKDPLDPKYEVHYIREIKTLFNRLIEETEKEYQNYHREMVQIFTGGKKELEGKGKYLIGKKLKDNTPPFEEDELNTLDFKCKSPEILRILIKWLEEMEEIVNDTEKEIMKKAAFKDIKPKATEAFPASEPLRRAMIEHLATKRTLLNKDQKIEHDIIVDLFDNICELVAEKPVGVQFLNIDDVKAIKFSQLLSSCIPFLTVSRIEFITRVFRTFQQEKNPKFGLLESLDLLTFSVFDLLRSKCSGTKDEIMEIYKRLRDSTYMKQIRVKNRLDTPMNDILINCKINKSPIVCEVQLIITNEFLTEKSNINDHFNHFLYELERSRFGPFSEACIIINSSDPRMSYAGELKKIRMKMNRLTQKEIDRFVVVGSEPRCHEGHKLTVLQFKLPFVCCMCSSFNSEYSSSFNGLQCAQCSLKICPRCIMDRMNEARDREELYMKNTKIERDFFEQQIFELRKEDPSGKDTLEKAIKKILIREDRQYALLIRFSQGTISKKGFKLLKQSKMLCPVYFLMKEDIPEMGKVETYDVLLLVRKAEFQILSVKDIKKNKNIEFMTDDITLDKLEPKANELKKGFVCLHSNAAAGRLLVIDYQNVEEDFEKAMANMRLMSLLNDCATTNNTTLELSSRNLTSLEIVDRKAESLKHVLTIVADDNQLTNIDVFLKMFPNLRKLSLKDNKLSQEKEFLLSDNFLDLFLAKNQFKELPVVKAKNVTRVSFKHNKLVNISKLALYEMPSLIEFGAAENKIKEVPAFVLPALEKLILKSNSIESLEFLSMSTAPNLKKLELDENQISVVPPLKFASLKDLVLAKNKLTSADWLKDSKMPGLSALDLSNNQLESLPDLTFSNLTKLDISNNKIGSMSFFSFAKMPKLKELLASNNWITNIPYMVLPNLAKLDFGNNRISRFESEKEGDEERTFIDSELRLLKWMRIVKNNKFYASAIIMMELERVFDYVDHIE